MSRLLIYDAQDRKPQALLQELATHRDVDFTYTTDRELLESALAQRNHDLVLVLVGAEPSAELFDLLSKARSLQQFGGALSLHATPSAEGIRAMLMLGTREVFVEPVAVHRVVQAVLARLHGTGGHAVGAFREIAHAECELRSFGRVARVSTVRPGELFVESDLSLEPGSELVLVDQLPAAFGLRRVTFRVARREDRDLYYGYQHGYWLDGPSDPRVLAGWDDWLIHARAHFVTPKPKVVWIGERRRAEVERWLSPAGWSLHPCRPASANDALLARVDPAVVVVDDAAPAAIDAVRRWAEAAPGRRVLQTTRAGGAPWAVLPADPAALGDLLPKPLPPPPDVAYPGRSSPLSRCTFSVQGAMCAVAAGGFEVASRVRAHEGSLLEVVGDHGARSAVGLYGRVLEVRSDGHGSRLRCEALPVTDDPYLSVVHAAREQAVRRTQVPRERLVPAPMPVRTGPMAVLGWVVAAVLLLGIAWTGLGRGPVTREASAPAASTEEVLQGIQHAFE